MSAAPFRCGTVALAGRANTGKSTLFNALVGQKLSIVTPKAQTTRERIRGIVTRPAFQLQLEDMPGTGAPAGSGLNRAMNRESAAGISGADGVALVVAAPRWTTGDSQALAAARDSGRPVVLVVNMIDRVRPRDRLLPFLERAAARHAFAAIVPVSATRNENLARLLDALVAVLPEAPAAWPDDQVTDRSERFLAAEAVREQLMLALREELPYGIAVEIERFEDTPDGRAEIDAVIWVERESQRRIVIGSGGALLKAVGTAARLALNEQLGRRVHLSTWVKVRENWTDDERLLRQLGHDPA